MKLFNCGSVDDKLYLWYSGENECFSGIWAVVQIAFIIIFAVLSLFPLFTWYLLSGLRENSKERRERYPALVVTYRPRCWYYESIMMTRRIVLLLVCRIHCCLFLMELMLSEH